MNANVGPWITYGPQVMTDDEPRHLTYAAYCAECAAERIRPVGIHRFRSLMDAHALRLAPADMDATRRRYDAPR